MLRIYYGFIFISTGIYLLSANLLWVCCIRDRGYNGEKRQFLPELAHSFIWGGKVNQISGF